VGTLEFGNQDLNFDVGIPLSEAQTLTSGWMWVHPATSVLRTGMTRVGLGGQKLSGGMV
jgi:hypothetical protein